MKYQLIEKFVSTKLWQSDMSEWNASFSFFNVMQSSCELNNFFHIFRLWYDIQAN